MNSSHGFALAAHSTVVRPPPAKARSLWFHYRNARMWGKPMVWSFRYAREARAKFG